MKPPVHEARRLRRRVRKLSEDVRFFGFTRFDFAGSRVNSDSPLHLKNSGTFFGVGIVWTLGRSSARAVD